MNRRDFLKLGGVISAAALVGFVPLGSLASIPVEAWSDDKLYRGTSDGKVYVSSNAGKSWQLHTNFGSEFSISALTPHHTGPLHAQLEYQGHSFELALALNKKNWKTV